MVLCAAISNKLIKMSFCQKMILPVDGPLMVHENAYTGALSPINVFKPFGSEAY